ncbi:MAG: DUF2807 domain-containing protein [Sphingomonas sp.]|nr:DUF2807 domain-containing protein [Sphingomonas sp.]MBW0007541.1 DUF2807 domain-containing protein [Sphingomonas sp.]
MRKSVAAVIAASALSGCQVHAKEDGGPTVSRNYQVGNFQQVEAAGPFDVVIRTGGNFSVAAQGPEKLLEHTTVEVKDGKLVIHPEREGGFFHFGHSYNGKATFTVTLPQLTGATLAGAGDMNVDKVASPEFKGAVAGAGDLTIGALEVQQLKVSLAGAGNFKGTGKAQSADYSLAGAGDVDASGIQTEQVKVSIAGAGGVKAHASGTADVSIVGAGDVEISGGAKCNVHKIGAGDVRCS